MRRVRLPEVAYGATAVRKQWSDLPGSLREAVAGPLGAPVSSARSAGGGFTSAFAATVETVAGERFFLKAAPLKSPDSLAYARESAVTALLPPGVAAARPLWTMVESGWFVLCLPAIDGRVPALPWDPAELDAALQAHGEAGRQLAEPPPALLELGVPALSDVVRAEMSCWSTRPPVATERLADLAALERDLPALVEGTALLHGDLRIDNVLIQPDGRAVLCDWTWPTLGQGWFDTVTLLVTAYASGLDADRYAERWHPPAGGVDAALAALSGYWLTRAADGPGSASPHSAQHRRFSGEQALAWLSARRGWSGCFGG